MQQGIQLCSPNNSPRKFGLAGKMIHDEKNPLFLSKKMSQPDMFVEPEFGEKRGVVDRLIFE